MPEITLIVDRDGRRVRSYQRLTEGPGTRERREQAAHGLFWCRGCEEWRSAELVRAGLCRPCTRAYDRRRYAEDPAYQARRKAHAHRRKRDVEPMLEEGAAILMETFEGRCAYCLEPAATWDHVLAVSRGGKTEPGNMLPACVSCNSRKRAKPLEQWLQEVAHLPAVTIEMLVLWGKVY